MNGKEYFKYLCDMVEDCFNNSELFNEFTNLVNDIPYNDVLHSDKYAEKYINDLRSTAGVDQFIRPYTMLEFLIAVAKAVADEVYTPYNIKTYGYRTPLQNAFRCILLQTGFSLNVFSFKKFNRNVAESLVMAINNRDFGNYIDCVNDYPRSMFGINNYGENPNTFDLKTIIENEKHKWRS